MSIAVRDPLNDKSFRLTMETTDLRFTTVCRSMFVRSSSHPRTGESEKVLDGAPTNDFTEFLSVRMGATHVGFYS